MNTIQIIQAAAAYADFTVSQLTLAFVREIKVDSKADIFTVKAGKSSGVHSLSGRDRLHKKASSVTGSESRLNFHLLLLGWIWGHQMR